MVAIVIYLVLGAVAGTLAGLLGVGGGLVIVPALIFVFQQQGVDSAVLTQMAIGTSLATICLTSISSIRAHHQKKAVLWAIAGRLTLGILLGALLGGLLADSLQGRVLQMLLGVFVVIAAIQMAFGLKPQAEKALPGVLGLSLVGCVIGSVSSLFGIGGGTITVPFLTWCRVNMQYAVGTSAACGLPIALAGTLSYVCVGYQNPSLPENSLGFVFLPAFFGIVVSSVVFANIGARLAHRIPAVQLKKGFSVLLLLVAVQLIAGNNVSVLLKSLFA